MSPETDILIVGHNEERLRKEYRLAFRHWQVYSVAAPFALEGRRFRRAYYTGGAENHANWWRVHGQLDAAARIQGAELLPFQDYVPPTTPDPQDFADAVLMSQLRRSRHAESWT